MTQTMTSFLPIRFVALLLGLPLFLSSPTWAQSGTSAPLGDAAGIAAHVRSAPPGAASTNALHFSPDGARIASYTPGAEIAIWDVETGERLQSIADGQGYVYQTQWAPGGNVLASASQDGTIHLWDVRTGERLRVLDGFSDGSPTMGGGLTEIWFSPDGRSLAAGQRFTPGRLVVWDRETETEVLRIERPRRMYAIDWGPAGDRLYTAEENGTVYAWSFPDGKPTGQWELERGQLFDLDAADTRVAAGGKSEQVHVVDTEDGTVLHQFDHGDFINNTVIVEGQPTVASVGANGVLKVWDTDRGTLRYERFAHDTGTWTVTTNSDGTLLATTGDDNYIRFWDVETGALVREIRGE